MIEMVIKEVPTWEIEIVTEELCEKAFKINSSSLCQRSNPIVKIFETAREKAHPIAAIKTSYNKLLDDGGVRFKGLFVAMGIDEEVLHEIIGFNLTECESEAIQGESFPRRKIAALKPLI